MKKLFVSVPMKHRTDEDIKKSIAKMHKIAEVLEGESLELIDSFINDAPKCTHEAVYYLGKSIQMLADADVFIGIEAPYEWNGCAIEREAAMRYGIKQYYIDPHAVIDNYGELMEMVYENARKVNCKA